MAKIVDKEAKKREIALHAFELFAQKGLHHTTVEEVAKAANVGKGTIYLYFANKEEIVLEIWEGFHEGHDAWFVENLPSCTTQAQKILNLLYFGHYDDALLEKATRLFGDYMAATFMGTTPLFKEHAIRKYECTIEQVGRYLEEGIQQGEFKAVDVITFSEMIVLLRDGCLSSSIQRGISVTQKRKTVLRLLGGLLESITITPKEPQ